MQMEFDVNSPVLFLLAGIVIAAVLAQSVFFLVKAWRRGLELGMEREKLKKIASTAAVFTIAPAAAIVISVMTLSKDLGLPLPWLRLSVVGSMSYETIAASNAERAMGLTFGQVTSLTASQYVTVALVMTVSILVGIWLVPVVCRRLLNGMISAFLGYVFCDVAGVVKGDLTGLIPVAVMTVSAVVMALCGLGRSRRGLGWLNDYALPISLITGMLSAIPITAWLS